MKNILSLSVCLWISKNFLQDLAGNLGEDLPAQAFNFRAATAQASPSTVVPTNSNAVGIVILIVCVAVFCILAGGIGLVKLFRSQALSSFLPKQSVRKQSYSSHVAETSKTETKASFADAKAGAETAYRAAAAAAERLRAEPGEAKDPKAATSAKESWAQRPSSRATWICFAVLCLFVLLLLNPLRKGLVLPFVFGVLEADSFGQGNECPKAWSESSSRRPRRFQRWPFSEVHSESWRKPRHKLQEMTIQCFNHYDYSILKYVKFPLWDRHSPLSNLIDVVWLFHVPGS